jgi:hypothetical protein
MLLDGAQMEVRCLRCWCCPERPGAAMPDCVMPTFTMPSDNALFVMRHGPVCGFPTASLLLPGRFEQPPFQADWVCISSKQTAKQTGLVSRILSPFQ